MENQLGLYKKETEILIHKIEYSLFIENILR